MTPKRAKEIAEKIQLHGEKIEWGHVRGFIADAILAAGDEQREADARIAEKMSGCSASAIASAIRRGGPA